jgi:hypothetical protein
MEETLKSLQLAHRLLMTLTIGILILVFSSNAGPGPFQSAYDELVEMNRVLPQILKLQEEEQQKYYSDAGVVSVIQEACPSLDIHGLKIETFLTANKDLQFIHPMFAANQDQPIDAYYNYLSLAPVWDRSLVYAFDREQLLAATKKYVDENNLKQIQELDVHAIQKEASAEVPDDGHCSFAVAGPPGDDGGRQTIGGYDDQVVQCTRVSLPFPKSATDLLLKKKLIEQSGDNTYLALPALRAVWDTAKGQDIRILADLLERKASAEKKEEETKLSFAGFSVDAHLALIGGPCGLILLLWYMLALVLHSKNLPESERLKARSSPLFGLWCSIPGSIFLITSIVVAPTFAGCALIALSLEHYRYRNGAVVIFIIVGLTISGKIILLMRSSARLVRARRSTPKQTRHGDSHIQIRTDS